MNKDFKVSVQVSAKEQRGDKAVEILKDKHGCLLYVTAAGASHWNSLPVDDQLLDMILNVILDFKHKVAKIHQRNAA